MKLIFTKHILERILQRGLNKETLIDILKNPDYIINSFENRKIAVKLLEKKWNIVFKEKNDKLIVITAYFD